MQELLFFNLPSFDTGKPVYKQRVKNKRNWFLVEQVQPLESKTKNVIC